MIELYHADGTRSLRVRWVLEELGLDYRLHEMPFPPRVRQPSFLDINPIGSLPFFVDGGVQMTESMAICDYLLALYDPGVLAIEPKEAGYADYRQFCWYGEATLMPPIGTLVRYTMMEPEDRRPQQVVDDARATFSEKLEPVIRALTNGEYLAAGRFTLADISVNYVIGLATLLGEGRNLPDILLAYRERLALRPAYRRAYGLSKI